MLEGCIFGVIRVCLGCAYGVIVVRVEYTVAFGPTRHRTLIVGLCGCELGSWFGSWFGSWLGVGLGAGLELHLGQQFLCFLAVLGDLGYGVLLLHHFGHCITTTASDESA